MRRAFCTVAMALICSPGCARSPGASASPPLDAGNDAGGDAGSMVQPDAGTGPTDGGAAVGPDGGGDAGSDAGGAPQPDSGAGGPDAGRTLRVLFIGDSYTYVNDLPGMLHQIAQSAGSGPSIITSDVVQGGSTLQDLWQETDALQAIADGGWTDVVLQGQSLEPTLAGNPENFLLYAQMFSEVIADAGARTDLFVTWARAPGDPSTYPILFDNPPEMQDDLTSSYDTANQAIRGSLLACAGPAFRQAISEHPEIHLQQADYSHPTVAGTYLAASTFYVALTGQPVPESSAVPAGLSASDAATLRSIALIGSNCAHVQLQGIVLIHDQLGNANVAFDGDGGPFEYGTAGSALPATFYVSNLGGTTVDLAPSEFLQPYQWTGGSYPGGQGTTSVFNQFNIPYCSGTLAPNQNCALSVTFDGSKSLRGTLSFGLAHAYTASASRWLDGTATSRALLSMNIWPAIFGACEDSAVCGDSMFSGYSMGMSAPLGGTQSMDVYVVNRGALPATSISGAKLAAPFSWGPPDGGGFPGGSGGVEYLGDAGFYPYCGAQALDPGQWCVVSANFSPTADGGPYPAELGLRYSDTEGQVIPDSEFGVSGELVEIRDGGSPWFNSGGDGGLWCGRDAGCLPP